MTKDQLIESVQKSCRNTNQSQQRFSYPGFGTFLVRNRKARKGRNPQTGAEIQIKASKTVGFKPAPKLKNLL